MNDSFPVSLYVRYLYVPGFTNFPIFIEMVNRFTANVMALKCTNFSLNDVGSRKAVAHKHLKSSKGDISQQSK
jgi:hypothetical protein